MVGLFFLAALLLATFWKARRELLHNFHLGRFRIAFLCALLIYDWTESAFKALHPMWFVFYITALDYPKKEQQVAVSPAEIADGMNPDEPPNNEDNLGAHGSEFAVK